MSTANNMTKQKLDVLRSVDGFENVLVKNVIPSSAQEALFPARNMYAGRCVSRASNGEVELGAKGRRVPMFLFRGSGAPSTGSASSPVAVENEVGLTTQDGAEHRVLAYVGIEGLELATTEFIVSSGTNYAINQFLKAPDATDFSGDANILAGAGKITNHQVVYGKDAVVGITSEIAHRTPHGIPMLCFYTLFRPPVEGLPDGIDEPTWLA